MKVKIAATLLVITLLVGMVGCGNSKGLKVDKTLDLNYITKLDLGSGMPKILFAKDGKVAWWGNFGLFVTNLEDGSIYRKVNLAAYDQNHMYGELSTRFLVSEDYNRIFFYTEDATTEENVQDFYFYYNIEEDALRELPVGTEVAVLPDAPNFSMEIAGGEQKGYTSAPVYYDDDTTVYLEAEKWEVRTLLLCKHTISTGETIKLPLF